MPVAPAGAVIAPRVVAVDRVSGDSPHPHACGNGDWAGLVQRGAEVEPYLAVDPSDDSQLLASWQQDRYTTGGGALTQGTIRSTDGGRSWAKAEIPGMTTCPAGDSRGVGDPWSSFSGRKQIYASGIVIAAPGGPFDVAAAHSKNLGSRWFGATRLLDHSDYVGGYFPDKSVVAADPTRPGHAYAAWTKNSSIPSPLFGSLRGVNAPVRVARTTDGGKNWGHEASAYTPAPRALGAFVSGIAVLPDGAIVLLTLEVDDADFQADTQGGTGPGNSLVRVVRSDDGGASWSQPITVAKEVNAEGLDPEGHYLRNGALPSLAVAGDRAIHVVWNDMSAPTVGAIRISTSDDDGATWSSPRTVTDRGTHPVMPEVAVMPRGRIGILFNDFRKDTRGDGRADESTWLATSAHGGHGWQQSKVAGPFDVAKGPRSGFLGDYQGLVGVHGGFDALFAAAPPLAAHGPSDVFFARLQMRRVPGQR